MKTALVRFASATFILLVISTVASAGPVSGFDGPYAPGNWTITLTNSDGGVDTSNAPASIRIIGSDTGGPGGGNTDFTIEVPGDGTISFAWAYQTSDEDGPGFDPFGFLLNGVFTQLTDNDGPDAQNGFENVSVQAGDIFGFRVRSNDNILGRAEATIRSFEGPDTSIAAIPEPTTLALWSLFGFGAAGYAYRRRRLSTP